jgi:hypothetical protein
MGEAWGTFMDLHWLRLPTLQHRYSLEWDKSMMCQAILMWHGKHGFKVRWEPLPEEREEARFDR